MKLSSESPGCRASVPALDLRPGDETARWHLFGPEAPQPLDLERAAHTFAQIAEATGNQLQSRCTAMISALGGDFPSVTTQLAGVEDQGQELLDDSRRLAGQRGARPLRVVLMGRTQAGKSTLFEFLTDGDGARVGDGRQRFSRDSCYAPCPGLPIEIGDTPGVGAADGAEDRVEAFRQAETADVVLWIAGDEATQTETAEALRTLAVLGKPIVVALNCRSRLDDDFALDDFLEAPHEVFNPDRLANLRQVERAISLGGSQSIVGVHLHALAALQSRIGNHSVEVASALRVASRVNHLLGALEVLAEKRDLRQAVQACDGLRSPMVAVSAELGTLESGLTEMVSALTESRRDFELRAARSIHDTQARLTAALSAVFEKRDRWAETADLGRSFRSEWTSTFEAVEQEVGAVFDEATVALESRLRLDLDGALTDWERPGRALPPSLPGHGPAWLNRAVKFAYAMGSAAVLRLGPGGAAVALALSNPIVKTKLFQALDAKVPSRVVIARRRRQRLGGRYRDALRETRAGVDSEAARVLGEWERAAQRVAAAMHDAIERHRELASAIRSWRADVESAISQIDLELARALLKAEGR